MQPVARFSRQPGSGPEQARFYSDLCFRLGKESEGFETCGATFALTLAICLCNGIWARHWRVALRQQKRLKSSGRRLINAEELDDKLRIVQQLSDLYLRTSQFDRLLTRLENNDGETAERRVSSLCLAHAFRQIRDYRSARLQLEKLLGEDSRDTQLLTELSKLAEVNEILKPP